MNERVFQTENAHAINQGINRLWHPETYYKNSNGASLAMSMLRCLCWFRQSNHGLEPSPTKWLESSHSPPCWWEWHDFHDYTWHRRSAKTSHRDDLVDTSSTVSREKKYSDWKVLAFQIDFQNCFQISNGLEMANGSCLISTRSNFISPKKNSRLRDWLLVWQLLPPQKHPTFGSCDFCRLFETNNSVRQAANSWW